MTIGAGSPRAWLTFVVAMLTALAGCQAISTPPNDTQARRQRNQELASEMDQRRDAAELLAARERFQCGEWGQARHMLTRLLARSPQNVQAQALLAEAARWEQQAAAQGGVVLASATGEPAAGAVRIPTGPAARGAVRRVGTGSAGDDENTAPDGAARARGLLEPADASLREGSTERAVGLIRQTCAANPQDPQIPISAGGLLLRYGQPEAAAGVLREAANHFATSAAVHRMLGTAYYRAGDYQAAQVVFQQALSLDKSSALSYFLMGCTLVKLGQAEAAGAHFRQAGMLDPRYGFGR